MDNAHRFGFETRMLHAGQIPDPQVGARAVPIYQTSSYVFESTDEAAHLFELKQYGNIYARLSNPTTAVFEERMASLEGGTGAVAVASGMAAQFATFLTLFQPGDEMVASSKLYGGTMTQLRYTLKRLDVEVKFVSPDNTEDWEAAITPRTRALFVETIGNPTGSIPDLEALGKLAKAHHIPLIVDSTFATPYLCRPIEWGATLVVHSATKFIGGHGNSIAGVVVDSGDFDFSRFPTIADPTPSYHGLRFFDTFGHYAFLMKLRVETVRDTGGCISPFNSFLMLQGLETLSVRMDRHVANAQAVAEFLEGHPKIARVNYAGLRSHPHHERAKKYLPKGPGAVMSIELKPPSGSSQSIQSIQSFPSSPSSSSSDSGPGSLGPSSPSVPSGSSFDIRHPSFPSGDAREAGRRFIEGLQLFSHLANVGDAKSLVIHPATTTHYKLTDEEMLAGGITPGMVRLSVGLETVEDLLWDLERALEGV